MSGFHFGNPNENKASGSFNFGTGTSAGLNPSTENTQSTTSSTFKSPPNPTNTGTTGTDGNASGFSFGNTMIKNNLSTGTGFSFTGQEAKETNPSTLATNGTDQNKGFLSGFQPLDSKPTSFSFSSNTGISKIGSATTPNVFGSSTTASGDSKGITAPSASGFSFGNTTATSDSAANSNDKNAAGSFSSGLKSAPSGSDFSFKPTNAEGNSKTENSADSNTATTSSSAFSFSNTNSLFKPSSTDDKIKSGGFSFATQPLKFGSTFTEQKQDSTTATTTPAATSSTGFSFGEKTPSTSTTSSGPAFSLSTSSSNAFGSKSTTTSSTPSTSTFSFNSGTTEGKSPAGYSFANPAPTSSAASEIGSKGETTFAQSTDLSAKPIPAKFIGRTVEEIINMWSEQLERNAETFTKEAVKVCNWDMELMESQKMLGDIANDVRRIQVGQKELDVNLDTIFAYQNELNSTLSELEQSVEKMYESQDQMPVAADIEREQTLQLAVDIDDQLNTLTDTLKGTVESMNQAQRETMDDDNPITQIIKVLNVHHNSLRWIEDNSSRMNQEINQLSKKLSTSTLQ
ncbi:unnamed protein product [Albugo candida]|uniref:Nucleoporin NSP1-like C-terminal domain-containing protein n=1 Tax=Albugo candida TaxID=65357 RepID=A0A024GF60_9STRA|nr:unnamed protein product [Albugo candida]|eukprot:CCI45180.1 unnamed protein product [Albugo candida]